MYNSQKNIFKIY